jgi:hypothetical protein
MAPSTAGSIRDLPKFSPWGFPFGEPVPLGETRVHTRDALVLDDVFLGISNPAARAC